ncbi:MAG: cation diffusion facilitator family transporter [Dermatophilaceae bacterium]
MSTEGGTKAVVAALAANLGIAATKLLAYLLTQSSSMLAESVHSLADSGNQVLLLIGGKQARRAADPEHPFGYGRVRYVYAFIVAIVLFSVGGLFALYEAYEKWHEVSLGHPNGLLESRWWWVPVVVLLAAIVMESLSFRTAIRESNQVRGAVRWKDFIRRAKSPELPVILLEDFAALLGLAFALVGVGLTLLTRNGLWDAAGTAMIGLLLVAVAVTLAVEMSSLLIGEAATPEQVHAILLALSSTEGVHRVIHLRTLHLGPDELLVVGKLAVNSAADGARLAETIDRAERAARSAVPGLVLVMYLEPDLDLGPSSRPAWERPNDESAAPAAGERPGSP